jgi:hypothetical protein
MIVSCGKSNLYPKDFNRRGEHSYHPAISTSKVDDPKDDSRIDPDSFTWYVMVSWPDHYEGNGRRARSDATPD